MGSFYTVATIKPLPRPVKTLTATPTTVYNGDPNISLPTTTPSTPQLNISLTLPSEVGDEPYQKRYAVGTAIAIRNTSASTGTVTVKIKVGNNTKTISESIGPGRYQTFLGILYFTPPANLEIYAWGSISGFVLYRVFAFTVGYHIYSNNVCTGFLFEISSICRSNIMSSSSDYTVNTVKMKNDTHTEATYGAGTTVRVVGPLRPNLYADEIFDSPYEDIELYSSACFLYPKKVMWGEV